MLKITILFCVFAACLSTDVSENRAQFKPESRHSRQANFFNNNNGAGGGMNVNTITVPCDIAGNMLNSGQFGGNVFNNNNNGRRKRADFTNNNFGPAGGSIINNNNMPNMPSGGNFQLVGCMCRLMQAIPQVPIPMPGPVPGPEPAPGPVPRPLPGSAPPAKNINNNNAAGGL